MSHDGISVASVSKPPWNFSWVVEGELAAMAVPECSAEVRYLVEQGVAHLVTLSPEVMPDLTDFPQLASTVIGVEEFEAPTQAQIGQFIEICERCKAANQAVGVHCHWGRGRTGVMAAAYLVRFAGAAAAGAVDSIRRRRPGSVETWGQEAAVRRYDDGRR